MHLQFFIQFNDDVSIGQFPCHKQDERLITYDNLEKTAKEAVVVYCLVSYHADIRL